MIKTKTMKKSLLVTALFAALMSFAVTGCSEKTETEEIISPSSGSSSLAKPTTAPEKVYIDGGWWMDSSVPNLVIDVNAKEQTASLVRYSGLGAFVRKADPQEGDIISQAQATKDWIFTLLGWKKAYKFSFEEKELYLYKFNDYGEEAPRFGTINSDRGVTQLNPETLTESWVPLLKEMSGTYSSNVVTIDNEDRYLYAVVAVADDTEADLLKASIYVCDSADVSDFSSLTPSVVIERLSFNVHQLCFVNDNYYVLVYDGPKLTLTNNPLGVKHTDLTKK